MPGLGLHGQSKVSEKHLKKKKETQRISFFNGVAAVGWLIFPWLIQRTAASIYILVLDMPANYRVFPELFLVVNCSTLV